MFWGRLHESASSIASQPSFTQSIGSLCYQEHSFKIPLFTHRSTLNLFNFLFELLILLTILYTQGIRILSAMDRIGKRVVHYIYVYIACI